MLSLTKIADALKGLYVKDSEGWGWPMDKEERETAARRIVDVMSVQHTSMKNVMFHANDAEKHSVYWSELTGSFALENEAKGRFFSSPYLCSALTQMHVLTGNYSGPKYNEQEYKALVPDTWTMTENPYA